MDEKSKEIIQRQSKVIVLLTIVVIVLLAAVLFLGFYGYRFNSFGQCGTKAEPQQVCGNAMMEIENQSKAREMGLKGDFNKGKSLFKQNCAVCHSLTDQKLTGPGLRGVFDRIPEPREQWLVNYILNCDKVIASGDPYANKINADSTLDMSIFEGVLTEGEVKDIIAYMVGNGY
jgi:mono/diheme cytochrome c family protein